LQIYIASGGYSVTKYAGGPRQEFVTEYFTLAVMRATSSLASQMKKAKAYEDDGTTSKVRTLLVICSFLLSYSCSECLQ
jgi:hypothetical protein